MCMLLICRVYRKLHNFLWCQGPYIIPVLWHQGLLAIWTVTPLKILNLKAEGETVVEEIKAGSEGQKR